MVGVWGEREEGHVARMGEVGTGGGEDDVTAGGKEGGREGERSEESRKTE